MQDIHSEDVELEYDQYSESRICCLASGKSLQYNDNINAVAFVHTF